MSDQHDDPTRPDMAPGDEAGPETASAGADLCPACDGTGEQDGAPCQACDGTGTVIEGVGGG